jgi:hypothetical protein
MMVDEFLLLDDDVVVAIFISLEFVILIFLEGLSPHFGDE